MNILVLGASGVVGSALVPILKGRGHNVISSDLRHAAVPDYIRCDIREYRQIEQALRQARPDMVYNLAAEYGRWNGEAFYENLWQTNVVGLRHILELQRDWNFRLVHMSSSEIYGDYDGEMTEDVPDKYPIRHLNDYATSKWVNEEQILNSTGETVRIRLFNTYGPGEYYTPYRSAIAKMCYGAIVNGEYEVFQGHTRSWTYITDACETLANVADRFVPGEVYNIAGKERVLMGRIAELIDTELSLMEKPRCRISYHPSEPRTTLHKIVSSDKAALHLGHNPSVRLRSGIRRTLEWMDSVYCSAAPRQLPLTALGFTTKL